MIRKYHNHRLQTTPWHREEDQLNHHETPGRQIKQSNQLSLKAISLKAHYHKKVVCFLSTTEIFEDV